MVLFYIYWHWKNNYHIEILAIDVIWIDGSLWRFGVASSDITDVWPRTRDQQTQRGKLLGSTTWRDITDTSLPMEVGALSKQCEALQVKPGPELRVYWVYSVYWVFDLFNTFSMVLIYPSGYLTVRHGTDGP